MAAVVVFGAGMMGTALTAPLSDRGHDVRLVGTHLDGDVIAAIRQTRAHPRLGVPVPDGVRPFLVEELERAMERADVLVLGVSSAGIRWAAEHIAPYARVGLPVAMITKGLDFVEGRLRVLPDVLADLLPTGAGIRPAGIAGPCIAGELARRVPTCVVVTSRDDAMLGRLRDVLAGPYYRVWTDSDVVGVEASAALKNAYAMGVGFGAGLHERRGGAAGSVAMHNYESAIFAQAVVEMRAIVAALGGRPDSVSGLAGVGDLDVTCNGGRTGRFGKLLGLGLSVEDAVSKMDGATLECVEVLDVLRDALPSMGLPHPKLPLLRHLMAVVFEGASVDPPFDEFF